MTGEKGLAGESTTVVGGGVGGLAAASYLAAAGADVTVVEQNDRVGGVANVLEREGFRFDTGPSWYLMPDVFERFFDQFDREPGDYYDLERLDPRYRVFWKDGDRVDAVDDRERMRELFESYEDGAGAALERYLDDAEESYRIGMDRFVYEDRSRLRDFIDPDVARSARGLTLLGSMDDHAAEYFDHPKLRQLVEYTLVFLGGSPYNTPAIYNMLAYVDFELGVYYPEGGMYAVVEGLADLAREHGVTFETGRRVTGLDPGSRGVTVETDRGPHRADRVVANASPAHVERDLLEPADRPRDPGYWSDRIYAPSAYMLYLGVEGSVEPLAHHTLVLPTDWDDHFEAIFDDPRWPRDPAYYVSVPSATDPTVAPDGANAVVVLVPVAPGLADGPEHRRAYREKVLADLAEHTGVDLRDRILVEEDACVQEFAGQVNAPQGTALGLAHTLDQTGPLRPGHRAGPERLYYSGGYTTPGIGVPMCLVSGEHTRDAVVADATDGGRPGAVTGRLAGLLGR
jgi:phytoene desaturase